jgi:hypothetical protein
MPSGRGQRPRLQRFANANSFDHILRSDESYAQKWDYVRDNPVRVGLVTSAEDWPYAGTVEHLEMVK